MLRPKSFAVLRYLVEHPRRLIKKEELLAALWGEVAVGDAVLKTTLKEIRHALGDSARCPRFVETAHGLGYRFIGALASTEEADAPSEVRCPRLDTDAWVGREAELARLHAVFERARRGERRVVFVSGEPGSGKSSLLGVYLTSLARAGAALISHARCVEQHGPGEPYLAITEALGRIGRVTGDVSPRTLRELADALESLARTKPLVLCLQDLQSADAGTLDLVQYLVQRTDPAALLLVLSHTPLDGSAAARERISAIEQRSVERGQAESVKLRPLSEQDVELLLARRFPGHALPSDLSGFLTRRSGGKPAFLVRLLDGWLERGWLCASEGRHTLRRSLVELAEDVPESIVLSIEAEKERRSAFEQRILEAASVLGEVFSMAALAAALREDPAEVERACLRLARAGRYLRPVESAGERSAIRRCQFIHPLHRQVIAQGLGDARRAQLLPRTSDPARDVLRRRRGDAAHRHTRAPQRLPQPPAGILAQLPSTAKTGRSV